MDIKAYIYHKRAEKYCDCQDWFGINVQTNRIAVSDGMSQSIFPQWWAEILGKAFLKEGKIPFDNIWPYQQVWQDRVREEIDKQESEGKNPWLLRDMFAERSGAGATICGFEWDKESWKCQCLGDSCLIKVNKDYSIEIITSQEGQFDNHPDYLDSFTNGRGEPVFKTGDFNLNAILMVSDPFAELFQIHQKDRDFICKRLNELHSLSDHESFVNLVEYWRNKFNLHNDDSTLIFIDNFRSTSLNIIWQDNLRQLCLDEKETDVVKQKNKVLQEEKEKAEAKFKSSVVDVLKYYPPGRKRSKNKVFDWLKEMYVSIVDTFVKK